jgi:hypothetical protein
LTKCRNWLDKNDATLTPVSLVKERDNPECERPLFRAVRVYDDIEQPTPHGVA